MYFEKLPLLSSDYKYNSSKRCFVEVKEARRHSNVVNILISMK